MEKVNVLLVDDQPEGLLALEAILQSLEQNLVKARSGREALRHLLAEDFAVILLDVQMPEMDGYETATFIRERPRCQHTPIIFLTASHKVDTQVIRGYAVGAVDYIFKPLDAEILRSKVSVFVELARKTDLVRKQTDWLRKSEQEARELAETRAELLTDLEKKHVELERARERAERESRFKDRFLTSMSHELRTPLNAILGFTGTLLMKLPGPLTADQETQLKTIKGSAKHLLSLINDLLDLAKIESGKVELKLEPVAFQAVLEEVGTTLRPLAESKGLQFQVKIPKQEIVLRTDRRALTQIVLNLTNNAIKFTEKGWVRLELAQHRGDGQKTTQIRVADSGAGIGPEDQARLFQAFVQLDSSATRRYEGTGLGLHLSQKLAELIGGRINLQSEVGKGSTFTLAFAEKQMVAGG